MSQIAGGKEALKKYIDSNLVYPEEAMDNRIEGIVYLIAEVDDNGRVVQVEIIKGLAGGCNDEAIRWIKNVKFGGVKNKGIRLKTKKQFRIKFQLPQENKINFNLIKKKEDVPKPEITKSYTYTIQIK